MSLNYEPASEPLHMQVLAVRDTLPVTFTSPETNPEFEG